MTRRRHGTVVGVVLAITLAGCTSGEGAGSGGDGAPASGDSQVTGDVGAITEMDPNFDAGSLPADFPTNLVPDSFTAGMYSEIGTVRGVNFESARSFDEVVAEFTSKIGAEPTIVEGEVRLASWLVDNWAISVFDSTPTLIGVATTE